MRTGLIEAIAVPQKPARHPRPAEPSPRSPSTNSTSRSGFETVRRSAPFATLPRSAFDATLDLLAGRYPSDQFAELRPRLVWDRVAGTIAGRPGAQRLAVTSGGTIPDRGMFGVFIVGTEEGARRVGELDEEMVYESRVGDVIALGATSWRIEEITSDRVLVTPAFGQPGRVPFWKGDGLGRPAELGAAIGAFTGDVAGSPTGVEERLRASGLDDWAVQNLVRFVAEQKAATGVVPTDATLVVERFRDELGDWRLVLHSPYGTPVHAPWALAISARIRERLGVEGQASAGDDGIVVRLPDTDADPPGADLFLFEKEELEELVTAEVGARRSSPPDSARTRPARCCSPATTRDAARRCGSSGNAARNCWMSRAPSGVPDHPRDGARSAAGRLRPPGARATDERYRRARGARRRGRDDEPVAVRPIAALRLRRGIPLRGRLAARRAPRGGALPRPDAARRTARSRRAAGTPRPRGDRADRAGAAATRPRPPGPRRRGARRPAATAGSTLDRGARCSLHRGGGRGGPRTTASSKPRHPRECRGARAMGDGGGRVAPARRPRCADPIGVPTAFLDSVADPVGDLVSRYSRTHGPFTAQEAADRFGLGVAVVTDVLRRLAADRRVVEGEFRPGAAGTEWWMPRCCGACGGARSRRCDRRVEPVSPRALGRFLPSWHRFGDLRGVDGVLTAIDQLAGLALPASAWESLILPSPRARLLPDDARRTDDDGRGALVGARRTPGR